MKYTPAKMNAIPNILRPPIFLPFHALSDQKVTTVVSELATIFEYCSP